MIQIRRGVFETNSSSMHSISIYSDADWRLIKNGVGYIQRFSKIHAKVYTKDEVIKKIVKNMTLIIHLSNCAIWLQMILMNISATIIFIRQIIKVII